MPFGQPTSRAEALFSLPFVTAMGLLRGGLTLADLDAQAWREAEISDLIARTETRAFPPSRPDLNYAEEDPDRMVVILTGGRAIEESCAFPLGAPQAPMNEAQLWSKFDANVGATSEAWRRRLGDWTSEADILSLFTEKGSVR